MKELLVVMYHYVMPPEDWKGSVPISPERFERQIIELKNKYSVISVEDLHIVTEKPKCLLTFDDMTRDQYLYAYPILKKHQISGHFAVMSGPLQKRRVPTFHLVHFLLSNYGDEEIYHSLQEYHHLLDEEKVNSYYYYEGSMKRRKIKFLLNFVMKEKESRKFLINKAMELYGSEKKFVENFYIQPEELKEMAGMGMTFGVHCVDHYPFRQPASTFFEQEIQPCYKYLRDELKIMPRWYTPPFGGGIAVDKMKVDLPLYITNLFEGAFTTEEGLEEIRKGNFWYRRIDANKLEEYL